MCVCAKSFTIQPLGSSFWWWKFCDRKDTEMNSWNFTLHKNAIFFNVRGKKTLTKLQRKNFSSSKKHFKLYFSSFNSYINFVDHPINQIENFVKANLMKLSSSNRHSTCLHWGIFFDELRVILFLQRGPWGCQKNCLSDCLRHLGESLPSELLATNQMNLSCQQTWDCDKRQEKSQVFTRANKMNS